MVDPWFWATFSKIKLQAGLYKMEGHEYQVEPLQNEARRQCYKKGAQMGFTEVSVLKTLHGMIYGKYPQGCLHLFPTKDDVTDFSKARFAPLIKDNYQEIGRFVKDTDAANIKRVGKAMLYMRGARATGRIAGFKKTSSHLKSVPSDRNVYDERDEMEGSMVDLAQERMSHSEIQEELYLSTPSIPDYGIDALYQESDQRVWMIRCEACGGETCLELEFPECLHETGDGRVIRLCQRCHNQEIHPQNGQWVAQYPARTSDLVGYWISQLNSVYVDPGRILELFTTPPDGNISEVYNSKLGMAHVETENRLNVKEVYACCGQDVMLTRHPGPCAMGVDIGKELHVVIGYRSSEKQKRIVKLARVSDFSDLHDLARRFNVKCAVLDMEPETRKAREFQEAENYTVFLCDYQERQKVAERKDEKEGVVSVRRTEICDRTHHLVTDGGQLEIPRRCPEVEEYAKEMCNIAKVLEEDPETGSKMYRYRKIGPDHYRHATNYFELACEGIRLPVRPRTGSAAEDEKNNQWDPLNRDRRAA